MPEASEVEPRCRMLLFLLADTPVESLHRGEIPWWHRLVFENPFHEGIFGLLRERPVEKLLVSEGRLRHRAQRFATRGTGAVARPQLEMIGMVSEAVDRSIQLSR